MNFEKLIRLNNYLKGLTITDVQLDTQREVDVIVHRSDISDSGVDRSFLQNIATRAEVLQNSFNEFEQDLIKFKQEVERLIEIEGKYWLQKSSAYYEKQLETRLNQRSDAHTLHKNKPVQFDEDLRKMLHDRVSSYSKWNHPGMIIHPMFESFIEGMFSSDPLYVVGESTDLLEPALSKINDYFRSKMRVYIIEESVDQPILDRLPNKQFGFCLAFNYLNYRPFELIQKYLNELYDKLLPGGVLIITFSDCDHQEAISLVEQSVVCYTPGSMIRGWAKYVGFEEIFNQTYLGANVWLELRKPGTLGSLRGGQSLAKILPKPIANSK